MARLLELTQLGLALLELKLPSLKRAGEWVGAVGTRVCADQRTICRLVDSEG